mgnify:CR=1 FL=1|jgi:hypothetical protein
MILKDWTFNVEYSSEILYLLVTSAEYSLIVNKIVYSEDKGELQDLKAFQKVSTAYFSSDRFD